MTFFRREDFPWSYCAASDDSAKVT